MLSVRVKPTLKPSSPEVGFLELCGSFLRKEPPAALIVPV